MELKTKYQYTYFIYPYVIKENKFTKYLLKLLKDKNCELKMFKKENDLSLYSYFSHRARNYMFNSFNYSKTRLARLNDLPLETKAAILAQNPCTIFEYNICFLCIKTNIEESNKFADLLNFNYKFRDINQEFANMNNYDNIRVQTDYFADVQYFKDFISGITGPMTEALKLDIDTERFLTFSYVCIDQEACFAIISYQVIIV